MTKLEIILPGKEENYNLSGFSSLMLSTQASGAQVEMLCLAIDIDSSRVDIGHPAAVGVALGVADIMAKLWSFSAQIALQSRFSFDI